MIALGSVWDKPESATVVGQPAFLVMATELIVDFCAKQ
jgi:hypothetical protein